MGGITEDNARGKLFEKVSKERKDINNPYVNDQSNNNGGQDGSNDERLKLVLVNNVQNYVFINDLPGKTEESCLVKTDEDNTEHVKVELKTVSEDSTRNVPVIDDRRFVKPNLPERINPGVRKKVNKKKAPKRRPVTNMVPSNFMPVEKKGRYSKPPPLFPAYDGHFASRGKLHSHLKASSPRKSKLFGRRPEGDLRRAVSSEEDFFTRRPLQENEDVNQDWMPDTVIDHALQHNQRRASLPVFQPEVFEYPSRPLVRQEEAHTPAQEAVPAPSPVPAPEGEEDESNSGYSRRRLVGFC